MAVEYNLNQFNSHKNITIKEMWENKSKDKTRTQDVTEFDFNNAYVSGNHSGVSQIIVTITELLHNDTLWFLWECYCLRIFFSIEMNRYNDYCNVITIHWAEALFLFKLNLSWPIQPSLSLTKPKPNAVLIKLLYHITSLGSCALVHSHVNPFTKLKQDKL
jgi:hypothetical protein